MPVPPQAFGGFAGEMYTLMEHRRPSTPRPVAMSGFGSPATTNIDAETLLKKIEQTPALVYSESALAQNLYHLRLALRSIPGLDFKIHFALKACYSPLVLSWLAQHDVGAEIVSALEFDLAAAAGFRGELIVCNGAGRPAQLLERLYREACLPIVDAPGDLALLSGFSEVMGRSVDIGLRVNPLCGKSSSHANYGKLGLVASSAAIKDFVRPIRRNKHVRITTLSFNLDANEETSYRYEQSMAELAPIWDDLNQIGHPFYLRQLDIGGGMREPTSAHNDTDEQFSRIGKAFRSLFNDARLLLEPGRYIVGSAGVVVTTVIDVKTRGGHTFIFVDAGTNVLIPLSTARYRVIYPLPDPQENLPVSDIVDGITNRNNVIVRDVRFANMPQIGDRLLIGSCGAYTQSLAAFWVYDLMPVFWLDTAGCLHTSLSPSDIRAARSVLLGV